MLKRKPEILSPAEQQQEYYEQARYECERQEKKTKCLVEEVERAAEELAIEEASIAGELAAEAAKTKQMNFALATTTFFSLPQPSRQETADSLRHSLTTSQDTLPPSQESTDDDLTNSNGK